MDLTPTRVHIWIGEGERRRRTTLTLHPRLLQLGKLALGEDLAGFSAWLGDELTRYLGSPPRGRGVRPGLTRHAEDIILSLIVRPELGEAWDEEGAWDDDNGSLS